MDQIVFKQRNYLINMQEFIDCGRDYINVISVYKFFLENVFIMYDFSSCVLLGV